MPQKNILRLLVIVSVWISGSVQGQNLLPASWNPQQKAAQVLATLTQVSALQVRGAHDAEMVMVGDYAYVVAEVNDIKPGEAANWPFIYSALSIVNLKTGTLEKVISMARSDQPFDNETLPTGACFVPRIIQKDNNTLRCFFASENPGIRQSQTWYMDFDLKTSAFTNRIYKAKLKTSVGIFDMQPRYLYADAVKNGFKKPEKDAGMYIFDSFKKWDGKIWVAINNYIGRQNALAVLNPEMDTFEVVGHMNEPQQAQLCEPAVNRLPNGSWLAIIRQDGGNYMFSSSKDGVTWSNGEYKSFVASGAASKPTFDKFGDTYYLGWQDSRTINGVGRSVFNIDVSKDGIHWERKYQFETPQTFQYPTFRAHQGSIWLVVTQGNKERIMFGKLEDL
ncbi:sialidase family protein [Spirosoma daeguense]